MREEILKEHSKKQALLVSGYIGNDPERFSELVDMFLNDEVRVVQRAGWIMSHCTDVYPDLIAPHLDKLIAYTSNDPPHDSVKRNVCRMMRYCELSEENEGPAYDLCWKLAFSTKEDIAVRSFALTVLYRIAEKHPDLSHEVLSIAEGLKDSESPGLRNSSRKIAIKLRKLIKKHL